MRRALAPALALTLTLAVALTLPPTALAEATDFGLSGDASEQAAQVRTLMETRRANIEHAKTRLQQIGVETETLEGRQATTNKRLTERARALYRLRRAGMLPVAGGFDGLMNHLSRVTRLTRMVQRDLKEQQFVKRRTAALAAERAELGTKIQQDTTDIGLLEQKAETLADQLATVDDFSGAFSGSTEPSNRDLAYGRLQVRGGSGGTDFAAMRGRLALPVQSARQIKDGAKRDGTGLEFVARSGHTVRCAAEGRVVFARAYEQYGNTVIVDHGDSYYTVYAGLSQITLMVGDWLGASARIGALADDSLYFEVRKGARALNARRWLGL